jgi:TolB-like protein
MVGKTISHYKITEKIGEGGMGEVYLADDAKLKRQVAIKFLPEHLTKEKENIERFEREAETAAALNHPNIVTIHNVIEEDDQEYFTDGMTEAIITELSGIKALHVISRTSIMRYKNTNKSIPEIAGELNVDAIVEGSTMLAGDQVRITAQLIEANTDMHLWAASYNRNLENILELQKDVAQAITQEIRIAVTPVEQMRLRD